VPGATVTDAVAPAASALMQGAQIEAAGFPFLVHSHMLRHSCGYKLANDRARYQGDPALSRPPLDRVGGALHGPDGSVQGALEGLRSPL
jgi:hypothetical protein